MMEQVILVDENDRECGVMEKMKAHEKGLTHRAFSVFVIRDREGKKEVLLQQRKKNKYHCGGLWSNTCCSHPRPGENILDAGKRRLNEEMGFSVPLKEIGVFHYRAEFLNGLIEDEVDHVLLGYYNDTSIHFNIEEVDDYQWIDADVLKEQIEKTPDVYTPWLPFALQTLKSFLKIHQF